MDTKANGPHSTPVLDRIDEAIIDVLRHQGRITYDELSSLVPLSPSPCLERVRKLERRGLHRIDEGRLHLRDVTALSLVAALYGDGKPAPRPLV